jgi:hemolysin D
VSSEQTARIIKWPGRTYRDEREFLPAALEIVETPPSPLGRSIALIIVTFFCAAVAWSWFGHVDIIATAQGQLVPTGKVKVVQPLDTGIVNAIDVQDGDTVKTGDLLVKLDNTEALADRDRASRDLIQTELDVARLLALKQELDPNKAVVAFSPPDGAPAGQVAQTRAFIWAQAAEQASKIASLDQQIEQKRVEADEIRASIDKTNAELPLLEEKDAIRTRLLNEQAGDRFQWLDAEQAVLDAKHNLIVQDRQIAEATDDAQSLVRQRDQAAAAYSHQILSDLADAERKSGEQTEDLVKAERKLAETQLRSPIDGVVQQLAIHTLGGVVTPAQQLLAIVPEDQSLVLEATISNADVGFVHPGQDVQVKVETYNFTRYGLIHGHVVDVSPDVATQEKKQSSDNSDNGGSANDTENSDKSQTDAGAYVARIALDNAAMRIDGKTQPLKAGMAVTAEIKTGSRRILQYLLSPLREYSDDAIRER